MTTLDADKVVVPIFNNQVCKGYQCAKSYLTRNTINETPEEINCCDGKFYPTYLLFEDPTCDIGKNSKGESPIIGTQSKYNTHTYLPFDCVYDREKIDTLDQVKKAIEKYGPTNRIAEAFCQTPADPTTCPAHLKTCSRYFSNGPIGDYCKTIFFNLPHEQMDNAIQNYCIRYNTDDCKCANRTTDKKYLRLKQGNPFSDACWYVPCGDYTQYLTPSEFWTREQNCPANICQIVFDIAKEHDVDVDHDDIEINCDFSGGKYPTHNPYLWYYLAGIVLSIILLVIYAG